MFHLSFFILPLILSALLHSFTAENDDFSSLFDGKDLNGWINVNCAPETWTVQDGMIICTGFPTGVLRTEQQYENFILELDWRHIHKNGNAGLFIHSDALTAPGQPFTRSIECQIMDGNEGDMFAIHGARLTPDNEDPFEKVGWMRSFPKEKRMNPTGDWNHYRVTSREGILSLAVNGAIVTRGFNIVPRKGYICLESEGSKVYFRNIRIKELPGNNLPSELVADNDQGFQSIYNGLDLRGWKSEDPLGWKSDNWKLVCDTGDPEQIILTQKEFGNFKLIADWCLNGDPKKNKVPVILPNGQQATDENGDKIWVPIRDAGRASILLRGTKNLKLEITSWPVGSGSLLDRNRDRIAIPVFAADNPPGEWNRFEISINDHHIDISLNGHIIIRNLVLGDLPGKGPIGLEFEGYPVQFANLYIKEL
jgi:hypothetical protein